MDLSPLFSYFDELGRELERLTPLQSQKIQAVRAHDLDQLNECMKQEQAISLALRGLEQKRDKLLQSLGLSGIPLRELPGRCPAEQQAAASQAVERLGRQYQTLRSAQQAARTVVEKDLRHVNQELEKRGVDLELEEHYSNSPGAAPRGTHTDFRA